MIAPRPQRHARSGEEEKVIPTQQPTRSPGEGRATFGVVARLLAIVAATLLFAVFNRAPAHSQTGQGADAPPITQKTKHGS